jgi:uncharacterized RDD family membrane protein YckC
MKCPKCHYLSFEPEARCRHCGHDFALVDGDLFAADPAPADASPAFDEIELQRVPAISPLATPGPLRPEPGARGVQVGGAPAASRPRPVPVAPRTPAPPQPGPQTSELPLFVTGLADSKLHQDSSPLKSVPPDIEHDLPVTVPAAPRPLSVRRTAPDTARLGRTAAQSNARRLGPLDHDILEDLQRLETEDRRRTSLEGAATAGGGASLLSRMAAGAVDVAFLAVLDAIAIVLTLRLSELPLADVPWTAAVPLVAFLWLIDLGYLLLFTVSSGQTIGKMALGLRVVDVSHDRPRERVTVRQAAYRALLTFPSVLALGAGFLPAMVGAGGAVHDRLSHTRVIRA